MKPIIRQRPIQPSPLRLTALACLWLLPLCLAAPGRVLDIRPQIVTRGGQVRLEELVVDAAALTSEQRAEVMLAEVPEFGAVQQLTLVDLAYRMQRCPSLLDFSLRGPSRITIQGGGDPAFLRRCQRDVTAALQSTAPWDSWTVSVRFTLDDERRLAEVSPLYERVTLRPRDRSALLGSVVLDVVFADAKGEVLSSCILAPAILREVPVLMMAEGNERGHVLGAQDIRVTTVWVGSETQPYATDSAAVVGSELNRRLGPGELLLSSHLAPPQCAARGELVRVVSETSGMTISLNAIAIDNGRLGETVRFRNTTSEAVFHAVLIGRKTARFQTR
ncbi:MAG: flagellar basal body P-ring formation chaperone FlgA [Lentisphaeria bacterium]|jgi:flagella basal body P-ring formation protein FlgA|nr:flagellar basal body P-ring formation chaperone FlgA [Lentisphaeria bacterium]